MIQSFSIDLRLTKFISWSDFEQRKIEKEYVQLLEDARIYYIIGKKTPNDEEILYIGSTNKNITNRIKFNHRGFVYALRNGWLEESLGLRFGYYEEKLVLPSEVEGYLIGMYKPKFNARKPNHKAIYNVIETGEFDRPERELPQQIIVKLELGPESLKTKLQWMRYINNLEKGEGIDFCLICDRRLVHEDDVIDTIHGVKSFHKQKLKNQSIGFSSYDVRLMLNIHRHFPQSFIGPLTAGGFLNFNRWEKMRFSKEISIKDLHPEFKNRKIHKYCDVYYLGNKYTFENIEKWRKYFGGNIIRNIANDMVEKQIGELGEV